MAENSKIEWTDHTFNPWMGCTKVSDGCKHCYAETMMDHRYGKVKWGPQGTRVKTAKDNWKKPLKWNEEIWRECLACGFRGKVGVDQPFYLCRCGSRENKPTRQRVFCASLADVFEYKKDQIDEMGQWRADLLKLIEQTPNLDWLLLTKRPDNAIWMLGNAMLRNNGDDGAAVIAAENWLRLHPNVWVGTSVETQNTADQRIPFLLDIPAKIKFVSCEPLLGQIYLSKHYGDNGYVDYLHRSNKINWVICGGESGPDARPMHPEWARSLRDQCQEAGVPFFFKQWGEWGPLKEFNPGAGTTFKHKPVRMGNDVMCCVGKGKAGSLLDGKEWKLWPA